MATSRPRFTLTVDEKMFQEIEDFRFTNRFPTRSAATVELIRLGVNETMLRSDNMNSEKEMLKQS